MDYRKIRMRKILRLSLIHLPIALIIIPLIAFLATWEQISDLKSILLIVVAGLVYCTPSIVLILSNKMTLEETTMANALGLIETAVLIGLAIVGFTLTVKYLG